MISGEYNHALDSKNRIILPVKLREQLGENIVMAKGVDLCVSVYPTDAWGTFTDKINSLPEIQSRKIKRFIYSSAVELATDTQGRILVPQNLKDYAGLGKNVTIIGVGDHVEIWDEENWKAEVSGENSADIAAAMISLGF